MGERGKNMDKLSVLRIKSLLAAKMLSCRVVYNSYCKWKV